MANLKTYDYERCLQSEQATVASCMILDKMIAGVRNYMSPEKFYHQPLGRIFQAICSLSDKKSPVDVVTIAEELRKNNFLESIGGGSYLAELINVVPFADHGEYYAKIASGYYYDRQIITLAGDLACSASDVSSREKTCTEYLEMLRDIIHTRDAIGLPSEFNYTDSLYEVLDNILKKKSGYRFEVGFPSLDKNLVGLTPGEVIVWGAAPNCGKSVMLLNIASHCLNRNDAVLYFSTEMSSEETVARHLSILTSIEPHKIKSKNLSSEEIVRLQDALRDRMHKKPMRIIDNPEPRLEDIEAALTKNRSQVLCLDYLQRFKLPSGDNYRLQVNDFMRRLKNLARQYNVVIHIASQLSREAYSKEEMRPILSHLSESSGIEKEADRVLLMWAPKEKNKDNNTPQASKQILEVILAKNRHGRRGLSLDLELDYKSLRLSEVEQVKELYS